MQHNAKHGEVGANVKAVSKAEERLHSEIGAGGGEQVDCGIGGGMGDDGLKKMGEGGLRGSKDCSVGVMTSGEQKGVEGGDVVGRIGVSEGGERGG